jgi:UDP-N-acetylmuramate dehydrogenase
MDSDNIFNDLKDKIAEDRILRNEPMKNHTSFKVGGEADFFVKVKNLDELRFLIEYTKKNNIPFKVIGNGTNLLVKDSGIDGIVCKIEMCEVEFLKDGNIKAECGLTNASLAYMLLKENLSGFEFACGIPGTIGGSIKQNAGAYGSEMKNVVTEVEILDLEDMKIKTLSNEECEFGYRTSIFYRIDAIVLSATMHFEHKDQDEIKAKMDENAESRKAKQPLEYPSAGSTFKRGEDFITAKVIDDCGLKGYTIGGAQVSEKHAGFIVNKGGATAQDILDLIEHIKRVVKEKEGKEIKLEVEVIGK